MLGARIHIPYGHTHTHTHTHTHMHTAQSPQEPILRLHKITDMEQIEILYLMSLFSKSVALKHCLRHVLTF
jgi:hypothetical protein